MSLFKSFLFSPVFLFLLISCKEQDSLHSQIRFAVVHAYDTQEIIKKCDLRMGNALQFEEHEIVKGTGQPYFYRLKLKKYKL
jgi:hypothetical protein